MFSLPQQDNYSVSQDVVALAEPERVLEQLLKMISGLVIRQWESTDEVEEVLLAAEKYEMQGPISLIRTAITSDPFRDNPFWLYAIATRFGWDTEAKIASRLSLELSIHDDEHTSILSRVPSAALRQLYHLHGARYRKFRSYLETESPFCSWKEKFCDGWRCTREVSYERWYVLKEAILKEMERNPSGDTLLAPEAEIWQKAEALSTFKCVCGASPYSNSVTFAKSIKSFLSELPSTV
jgi:hypothetical protein